MPEKYIELEEYELVLKFNFLEGKQGKNRKIL